MGDHSVFNRHVTSIASRLAVPQDFRVEMRTVGKNVNFAVPIGNKHVVSISQLRVKFPATRILCVGKRIERKS